MVQVREGRPYPPTGLTTALWERIEPEWVATAALVTTQRHLYWDALLADPAPGYVHVVEWDGRWYLEDGHHRVFQAVSRGEERVAARVFRRHRQAAAIPGQGHVALPLDSMTGRPVY